MKKALIFGLSLSLVLSLTACGGSIDNAASNTQNTTTPEVSQSVESSTPIPEQTTPETAPTPESVSTPAQENTAAPQETDSLFTDCSETMYATTTVNVRSSYSTNSDKLGSLTKAQSVTRTGIGTGDAAGWSRIEFNGKVAYVSSDYLSATKPQVSTGSNSGNSSGQTSKPSSKPSTGGNSGSSGGQTSKPSTSTGGSTSSGSSNQVGQPPASGGLGGLINADNGGDSDAFKDTSVKENAGINVN